MKKIASVSSALVFLAAVLFLGTTLRVPDSHAKEQDAEYSCEDTCKDASPWMNSVATFAVNETCEVQVHYRTRQCGDDFDFEILSILPLNNPECRRVSVDHTFWINYAVHRILTDPSAPATPGFRPPPGDCRDIRGYTSNCWKTQVAPYFTPLTPCTEQCCYKNWTLCTTEQGWPNANWWPGESEAPLACPEVPGSACGLSYACSGQ